MDVNWTCVVYYENGSSGLTLFQFNCIVLLAPCCSQVNSCTSCMLSLLTTLRFVYLLYSLYEMLLLDWYPTLLYCSTSQFSRTWLNNFAGSLLLPIYKSYVSPLIRLNWILVQSIFLISFWSALRPLCSPHQNRYSSIQILWMHWSLPLE